MKHVCNVFKDLSDRICVLSKSEDLNLKLFNIISGMNESKTLVKHISYNCRCKYDGNNCNSM